ncbi:MULTISPECIES: J domain-containing protein [unclassified Cupriavidus]|uniref:J domain-containing protein n=1 Tax=unclassified Cupriavidus TaxID=2640874 RepID=UPI0013664900|nr:J domain-containing protein [Cupriavidus sp. SW-Y-13]MWL89133.1 DnaJ domain-containing protein [Cupriavidus sp. SW-Y-13]
MTTLYATLGVQSDATQDEIRRAYRRAAMKWHPDRNLGREAEAHDAFQEVRNAYAILSDAVQRQVYDEVFEREMQRWQAEHAAEEEQERAAQREAQRIAQEHYERMVTIAMRFADLGHNRDVIFGALLGRDCEAGLAARVADSVWALQQSRNAPPQAAASASEEERHPRQDTGTFDSFWRGLFGVRS